MSEIKVYKIGDKVGCGRIVTRVDGDTVYFTGNKGSGSFSKVYMSMISDEFYKAAKKYYEEESISSEIIMLEKDNERS